MKIADLSHYNGTINWKKARTELSFVIFRASCGMTKDNKYTDYAKNCGLPYGVYHFVKASNKAEAEKEATWFYKCATSNGLKPLFFVADIEYKSCTSKTTGAITEAFAAKLRELGAQKLGLYIGKSLYPYANKQVYDFVWGARYGKNTGKKDDKYKPNFACALWQYTSKGRVAGISGNVDLDALNGKKDLAWFLEGYDGNVSDVLDANEQIQLTTTATVHLRATDSTDAESLGIAEANTVFLPYLNKNGNPMQSAAGWYPVHYNGGTAWISGKYIQEKIG